MPRPVSWASSFEGSREDQPDGRAAVESDWTITRRVTLGGTVTNVMLTTAKTVVGWLGNSQALVADGVHSLSDLMSDVLVLAAARIGSQHADSNIPTGMRGSKPWRPP